MEDFLQEKPKKKTHSVSFHRLFVFIFALALLGQVISFIHLQLSHYHQRLTQDFKVILTVSAPADNTLLSTWGESLSAKTDITEVRLFSPQDGLAALQTKNPRFAASLVTLGRDTMPAYFELKLTDAGISNVQSFVQNIAAEYPSLSVNYSAAQADMIFYTGLCLRVIQFAIILSLVCFVLFMFLVEAYPMRGKSHAPAALGYGALAGVLSLVGMCLLVYPTGFLMPALQHFTSVERQISIVVFCTLLGWSLGKWQKF